MRHPTTGLSEDDLSRLTGSSSSTSSAGNSCAPSSSSSSSSSAASSPTGAHFKDGIELDAASHPQQSASNVLSISNNNKRNSLTTHTNVTTSRFNSTYLPEIINPLEWQKSSRKRKERLDSTSSTTQDRKLQRSNSEELLPPTVAAESKEATDELATPTADGDGSAEQAQKLQQRPIEVIRRVSSEDFKKTSYAAYEKELLREIECDNNNSKHSAENNNVTAAEAQEEQGQQVLDENDASLANRQTSHEPLPPPYVCGSGPTKDMTRRSRHETSPARSHRHSPIRGGKYRDSDDSECEHERRRSSERFCKSRAPPGRKAVGVIKKSSSNSGSSCSAGNSKYIQSKRGDETVYKYDLGALKHERRGFISKKVVAEKSQSAQSAPSANDHNDNNLIDFHQAKQSPVVAKRTPATATSPSPASSEDTSTATTPTAISAATNSKIPITSAQEALPWDCAVPEDHAPMLSQRYAAVRHHPVYNIDTAAKLAKVMPYPQPVHKLQTAAQLLADDMDCIEPLDAFRAFSSLRTRDVMEQVIPAMMSFQSPEERLKQVNKRLTAMKKKLAQLEEAYETRAGYRPSQAERMNDKYMKHILAELSKLRKERHELKADPMGAVGVKVSGGMDASMKLDQMKSTLLEIEQNLADKRETANRSETLDELTPDQLLQEKSAVQHGLLYLESLYGRPNSKDERDAARSLYDRYRQLKRLVSRSVLLTGCAAAGAPELPTILEHEAMVFESSPQPYYSNNSTDTTNSPCDSLAPNSSNTNTAAAGSSDDSTTTTTANTAQNAAEAATASAAMPASDTNETISALSIEELWEDLDRTREEKKLLKRTIREFETVFEEQNGRKLLKNDRKTIEETYAQYKQKKARTRLLQALIKKHISR